MNLDDTKDNRNGDDIIAQCSNGETFARSALAAFEVEKFLEDVR
jgi:hypothetical protein